MTTLINLSLACLALANLILLIALVRWAKYAQKHMTGIGLLISVTYEKIKRIEEGSKRFTDMLNTDDIE